MEPRLVQNLGLRERERERHTQSGREHIEREPEQETYRKVYTEEERPK